MASLYDQCPIEKARKRQWMLKFGIEPEPPGTKADILQARLRFFPLR